MAVVILMTLVFLVWFAVISMQLFGYLTPEDEACRTVEGGQFDNFFVVSSGDGVSCVFVCPCICLLSEEATAVKGLNTVHV